MSEAATVMTAGAAVAPVSVLIVEDEALLARAVARRLEQSGYACAVATSLAEARSRFGEASAAPPEVVLLDVRLPDGSGFDLLTELAGNESMGPPSVIIFTAYGEITDAVAAMKLGAADYLKKPVDLDELELSLERALKAQERERRLLTSRERQGRAAEGLALLGESRAMVRARERIAQIAGIDAHDGEPAPTVLILGETGTGKDVAARLIHRGGQRADRPFVHVDCATLPRDLIEAELFGHVRGAYTGATGQRVGLIEAAEDGTVFLDEIGELPLELQGKLLSVIERRRLRRIGSPREVSVPARFIAATNRRLADLTAEGAFRSDLYYRLNVLTLEMPALRDCEGDVMVLARHFVARTARRYGRAPALLSRDAETTLRRYRWPGNVRELEHIVERAVLLSEGDVVTAAALGLDRNAEAAPGTLADPLAGLTLETAERNLIVAALERTNGNVSEAARQLGVTRMALRYRIEKHRLD